MPLDLFDDGAPDCEAAGFAPALELALGFPIDNANLVALNEFLALLFF